MTVNGLKTENVLAEWTSQDPMDLVRLGIAEARESHYERGLIFLAEAYRQLSSNKEISLPGSLLSYYGLCLTLHKGRIKEGAEFCQLALEREFYNAESYLNLARVWLAAGSRRKAVEALEKGMSVDPRHNGLKKLYLSLGVRRRPVVPFLHRDNPLNVSLGRLRRKLEPPGSRSRKPGPRKA